PHTHRIVANADVGGLIQFHHVQALLDAYAVDAIEPGEDVEIAATGEFIKMVFAVRDVAELRFDGRPFTDDVVAKDAGMPGGGPALADQDFDRGAFARAVGAEESEQFTASDFQVQVIDGNKRAIAYRQAVQANDRGRGHFKT